MAKRNIIYSTRYEAEVALIFAAVVFLIILFSGCMRDLQPTLDPIIPQWEDNAQVQTCCEKCQGVEPVSDTSFAYKPVQWRGVVLRDK